MTIDNSTPETVTIPLTQGQVTIVDAIDADLDSLKWSAHRTPSRRKGYQHTAVRKSKGANVHMHRVILERALGRQLSKSEMVDHINCNPLDNRRGNLRLATRAENSRNTYKQSNNTSGFKGVYKISRGQGWYAMITVDGNQIFLGNFDTPELAHTAYCQAARKYHGNFANLG